MKKFKPDIITFPHQFKCACGKIARFGDKVDLQKAFKRNDAKFLGVWKCKQCKDKDK